MTVGCYVIDAKLGARGTGVFYRACNVDTDETVILKVMPAMHGWTRSVALQVLADACVIDTIDHPGVATVLECGTLPDCRPWVSVEHVPGTTLTSAIGKWNMSALEVAHLIRAVVRVLEHAHAHDIIHGHLTPDAIVIPDDRVRSPVVISDWTEARIASSPRPAALFPRIAATSFDAPEQRRGERFDGRADVYALGMIACSLLYRQVLDGTVDVPVPPQVPVALATLLDDMIRPDPAFRPTSAVVRALIDSVIASFDEQRAAIASFELDESPTSRTKTLPDGVPIVAPHETSAPRRRRFSSDDGLEVSGEIEARAPIRPSPLPS